MRLITLERNKSLIIKITGDIDHHRADDLKDDIDRVYARTQCRNIIFDFAGVGFMDSSGIGMLIGRYKNVQRKNGSIAIANMSMDVNRIYQLSGLQKLMSSYKTLDEAEQVLG